MEQRVLGSSLILVGRVANVKDGSGFTLEVESYLKGPATDPRFAFRYQPSSCELAKVREDGRILVFLHGSPPNLDWPFSNDVYLFADGVASGREPDRSETDVVASIRSLTGQFAVPAATESEGASLDWKKTVLPVGLATIGVFIVSLFLMRLWHRIDPS